MRIITGTYRGRILKSPDDTSVRPATDRVKSTIYNMLQNRLRLQGTRVLDLFAGSGSLGFEAISRGAESCVFVDNNRHTLDLIEENAAALQCLRQCEIIQDDAMMFIERPGKGFDLVFADPPYAFGACGEIPERIFRNGMIHPDGFLIIEHHKTVVMPQSELYSLVVQKQFGGTRVSFFTHPNKKKDTV